MLRFCKRVVASNQWEFLSFVMTMTALFLDGMRDAFIPIEYDAVVNNVLFTTFLFFIFEMGLLSYCERGYFNSFFFWLDFVGTVSLIFDIPFLLRVSIRQSGLIYQIPPRKSLHL